MPEKVCSGGNDHVWGCRQVKGAIGVEEIRLWRPLSFSQTKQVVLDPAKSETICPGGLIVCRNCEAPLIASQVNPAPAIDIDILTRMLPGEGN